MCNIFKKHIALFAMLMVFTISVCAQTYTDSIKPFSGTKPFRKWSVGVNVGALYPAVATRGSDDFTNPKISIGYGVNVKYQVTHWFALQFDIERGKLKGDQGRNLANGQAPFPTVRKVKEFKTDLHYAADISGVLTLGNINWLSAKNKVIPYVSLGAGFADWHTDIISVASNPNFVYYDPKKKNTNEVFFPVGLGLKINLSSLINLDLGYKMNYVDNDALDGYSYTSQGLPGRALHKDKFSYGFVGIEFALGKKSMPQLMFDNPASRMNNNLQNQIDVLRSQLNLADTDGDGVADIFDKEPNTPAGCPVDTHGVTKDTDGDGVPDCKDQQLITPTECQPVDANGVGKCPPPECCSKIPAPVVEKVETCTVGDLPSLSFKGNAATLSADAKAILASVAAKLKESPICTITITGYPAASKASQAVCNKRTDAIKMYLISNEGISADRLSVNCEVGGGDANTIDLKVK